MVFASGAPVLAFTSLFFVDDELTLAGFSVPASFTVFLTFVPWVDSECVSCMVKGCDVCNSSLVCHTCKFGHELTASGTCRNTGAGSSTNNERLPKKDARRLFNY